MKAQLKSILKETTDQRLARLQLREYLQHLVLRQLFEMKQLSRWIFQGGTALRIIHGLNRYSEDLDFQLLTPIKNYSLSDSVAELRKHLQRQGYSVSTSPVREKTVCSAFIRFEGLLTELGLTRNANEKLSVKLEIDTNPPEGYGKKSALINRYFPFALYHHDLPSFLAGKIHAILHRNYTKGRDYYDLIFLLSRWPDLEPNIPFLVNALSQTAYSGQIINDQNWRYVLLRRIEEVNWAAVVKDVEPFLESQADRELLNHEYLIQLLNSQVSG